jgi:hypothetical protein
MTGGGIMKNQYFGDGRDYLKYDVLDRLASELDAPESFWQPCFRPVGQVDHVIALTRSPEAPQTSP